MLKKPARFVLARHCRLTISPASPNVSLMILRAVALAAALLDEHFEHLAEIYPYFMCNPSKLHVRIEPLLWLIPA